jgi:mRNA interferase MazF
MLTSGDAVDLDLGRPAGREAAYSHPALVVTAQRILDAGPNVIQVVPLTSSIRTFGSEVVVEADSTNGLNRDSSAQCQHVRAVSIGRVEQVRGNVGSVVLTQIREVIGLILDIPS